jgi:hypothetical protein
MSIIHCNKLLTVCVKSESSTSKWEVSVGLLTSGTYGAFTTNIQAF